MIFGSVRSARRSDRGTKPIVYDWKYLLSLKSEFTTPPIGMRSLEHLKLSTEELARIQEPNTSCFSRDSMLSVRSTGENAWRLSKSSEDDNQKFLKEIRGMLNKITPQKYVDIICHTDLTRVYKNDDRMSAVVRLIFDKALQDNTYSQLYVELSKDILSFAPKPEKGAEFRRQIIERTQYEFENSMRAERWASEIEEQKFQKRQQANMIFIGELYISDLLNANIAIHIVSSLLGEHPDIPTPTAIEMLSKFIRRIGETLTKNSVEFVDSAMQRLDFLLKHGDYSPRIRFMIMDILDARAKKWKTVFLNPNDQSVLFRPATVD